MDITQNILLIAAVVFAFWILYDKFFKKKKKANGCSNDDCGC